MAYEAEIVLDSIAPSGSRLTTFQLKYPRFIHAEFLTHRQFSRNAQSNRAFPTKKLLKDVREDPVFPISWGKNKRGMQAEEELTEEEQGIAATTWQTAYKDALEHAEALKNLGVHKQVVNRLLEPFSWISVIVSSTNFSNFFALRCHPDAQPEIQKLAYMMKDLYDSNEPERRLWHLPYTVDREHDSLSLEELIRLSVARCARVSYLNHEGERDWEKDLRLHDTLLKEVHMSPFEHQAEAMSSMWPSGNFVGWKQARKTIPGECR